MAQEWHPDVLACMDRIDAVLARNRAIVASWGFGEVEVPTREEREAEFREIRQNEPPHLGLGYPVPQDWIDGEEQAERKWRSGSLRKNMGLQASKPRKVPEKSTKAVGNVAGDSSDEEEGRTGLGKVKKRAPAHTYESGRGGSSDEGAAEPGLTEIPRELTGSVKADKRTTSLQDILANSSKEPNSEKIELWTQKTAEALNQSPTHPIHTPVSPSSDFPRESQMKTLHQNTISQESTLNSARREKGESSKKRKLLDYDDNASRGHAKSNGKLAKLSKPTRSDDSVLQSAHNPPGKGSEKAEGTLSYEVTFMEKLPKKPNLGTGTSRGQYVEKAGKDGSKEENGGLMVAIAGTESLSEAGERTGYVRDHTEEHVGAGMPVRNDAEARAKMKQLARERLGSGSYSKKKGRAKVQSSNSAFDINMEKEKKKPKMNMKGSSLKANFS